MSLVLGTERLHIRGDRGKKTIRYGPVAQAFHPELAMEACELSENKTTQVKPVLPSY